ncbi:MAG: TetR/AcrR family transcriptional regulator [Oceanospirillaceae bacterium]|nr:TetR/AcrR family transcriptional regulator [Oceanospirillaceae bacterium]
MATTRDLLVETMKQLLWERGYDATSPNLVLERSGAGKGSFYHHFKGKKELAIAAMESRADELCEEFDRLVAVHSDPLAAVEAYMCLTRDAATGCRIGRIVQDPSLEDPLLNAPLKRFFGELHGKLSQLFLKAQTGAQLSDALSPDQLATLAISALQGGFVYGRAVQDGAAVNEATEGFIMLLNTQRLVR